MVFSIGLNIIVWYKRRLSLLRFKQDANDFSWMSNNKLGIQFYLPKNLNTKQGALNMAKLWLYQMILDHKTMKYNILKGKDNSFCPCGRIK